MSGRNMMKKKIGVWLPLGIPIILHIVLCGLMVFTEIGGLLSIILLPIIFFLVIPVIILFYFAGKWTEKMKKHTGILRFIIAFVCGCIYSITFPFLTKLDSFIKWGDWKAFFITLSAEKIFFLLIPFLMTFIPCWIGQEVQNRATDTISDEQEEKTE